VNPSRKPSDVHQTGGVPNPALPVDTTARLGELISDDRFLVALLKAAVVNRLSQPTTGGATRHSSELNWQLLTTWISEATLAAAVQRLDADHVDVETDTRAIILEAKRNALVVDRSRDN
jgi:hypothetical protein